MPLDATVALALGLALAGCARKQAAPDGQLLLYVNTDAPLPPAAGETPGLNEPAPLFDRVRIEVFRPGDVTPCAECTHEFDLDRALVGEGRASAGIVTPVGVSGYRARVRLFRAAFVELGEPRADGTIESVVALPSIAAEGIHEITAVLRTDDVARPRGTLADPVLPEEGPAKAGLAGTWPSAKRIPCSGVPVANEVCVPGGAFWMGDPETRLNHVVGDPVELRIAVVAPFYMNATEVTVGELRDARFAKDNDPIPWTEDSPFPARCSYTTGVANHEELPVTCISWQRARAYCQSRGADLPSEAQFGYAASALGTSHFVWGDDEPTCNDAIYGRSGDVPEESCPGFGAAPPRSGDRDVLALSGGEIYDLAGNVTEYARDLFALSTEPCWDVGVAIEPVCETSTTTLKYEAHTVVGGFWFGAASTLAGAMRQPTYDFAAAQSAGPNGGPLYSSPASATGFRCVRDASE